MFCIERIRSEISVNSHRHAESSASSTIRCRSNKILGWSWIFTVAVRAINRSIHDEIATVEDNVVPSKTTATLEGWAAGNLGATARALLALLCEEEEAAAYVRSGVHGNGLQVWQALLEAKTVRNPNESDEPIVGPAFFVERTEIPSATMEAACERAPSHSWSWKIGKVEEKSGKTSISTRCCHVPCGNI